ncbi:MAG: hypothetical protein V2J12_00400 [Gammaproteobacteria bacterium]|jgi:hypothetical protein|nr:hypothetical protein [Gammaproteobacteria bacterium]
MSAAWSRLECELIVEDYLAMLAKLDNRSEGSIEYKHQNISAVLIHAGCA